MLQRYSAAPLTVFAATVAQTQRRFQFETKSRRSTKLDHVALREEGELPKAAMTGDDVGNTNDFDQLKAVHEKEAEEEEREIDFTVGGKVQQLEKLYHKPVFAESEGILSERERRMFTQMIYDAFYKEDAQTEMDPALMYQAGLEITWIEEWVAKQVREGVAKKESTVAAETQMSTEDARKLVKKSLLERVDLRKPLSYIIGMQPFYGCEIACRQPLLCPRPETEMWAHWLAYNYLIKAVAQHQRSESDSAAAPSMRILDVCCGTGCIGVSLARHVPGCAVVGLDLLPLAVETSEKNARLNGIPSSRYRAIRSDMFEEFLKADSSAPSSTASVSSRDKDADKGRTEERPIGEIAAEHRGSFDVIVSNPPYVLPEQYIELPSTITHWESKTALVGDDYRESRQYLYFKELCVLGAQLLKPQRQRLPGLRDAPNMCIEVGLQAHVVATLMEKSGLWKDIEVHLDYAQQERWITANSVH